GRRGSRGREQQRIGREPRPVVAERAAEREVPPEIVGENRLRNGPAEQRAASGGGGVREHGIRSRIPHATGGPRDGGLIREPSGSATPLRPAKPSARDRTTRSPTPRTRCSR